MIKIILDAMGGDNAPAATVCGAVEALKADKELGIVLTGRGSWRNTITTKTVSK